jgi:hypothetical protein
LDTRTEANLNRIASDVHLVTAPLRFIWHVLLVTLFAVQAVVGAVQGVAEIFDAIWRWQPLFGITLLALVNSAWMLLVRAIYACIDKENLSNVATRWCAFFGFTFHCWGKRTETVPPRFSESLAHL